MITSAQTWHTEDVLGLAPYTTTAIEAQRFAHREHWQKLGSDGTHVWGTFQDKRNTGTIRELQTAVNLSNLQINSGGISCECRSQMPCHHTIALMLLVIQDEAAFKPGTTPSFVRDNIFARLLKVKPDEETRGDVQRALLQLDQWLTTLIRDGLARPDVRTFEFWDDMADRMLAVWMPGMSQWLRDIATIAVRNRDWVEPLLEELGRLYLLVRSFDRFDQLPATVQADIWDVFGLRLPEGSITNTVRDRWFVLGQRQRSLRNRVPEQLTWLYGLESKQTALLHSIGTQEVLQTSPFAVGRVLDAELAYLSSRVQLKAQLMASHDYAPREAIQGASISEAVESFGQAITRNPWLRHYPVLLKDVYVSRFGKGWTLRHADGTCLPIAPYFQHKWVLHAAHSGRPIQVAAVWDGRSLFPISAMTADGIIDLNQIIRYTRR